MPAAAGLVPVTTAGTCDLVVLPQAPPPHRAGPWNNAAMAAAKAGGGGSSRATEQACEAVTAAGTARGTVAWGSPGGSGGEVAAPSGGRRRGDMVPPAHRFKEALGAPKTLLGCLRPFYSTAGRNRREQGEMQHPGVAAATTPPLRAPNPSAHFG